MLRRSVFVVIHRYAGLSVAAFLLVAGLTGSLLAFNHELDAALNPQLFHVTPPTPAARPLDPLTLRERIAEQVPAREVRELSLETTPGESVMLWLAPAAGEAAVAGGTSGSADDDQHFFDPYTGKLLGSRHWGDLSQGLVNLMPFIYRLHYQLALGEVGNVLFGCIAVLWTIDCFIGLYLTFPARRVARTTAPAGDASASDSSATGAFDQRSWWARWKPSWLVRGSSLFATIFTFHRASGLWVFPLLLVFAWSAVSLNLRPLYEPVMNVAFTTIDVWGGLPTLAEPRPQPTLGWNDALATGRRLMREQSTTRGFSVHQESSLAYEPSQGLYRYDVKSSWDVTANWPGTRVWFDGEHGALVAFDAPTGVVSGNTITAWLVALHMAAIGGLAYQGVVCVLGLLVAGLCVTGVIIWWRKRALRRAARQATGESSSLGTVDTASALRESGALVAAAWSTP